MSIKEIKTWRNEKKQKSIRGIFVFFFHVPLTLLYTITSSWCGRFDTPCIYLPNSRTHLFLFLFYLLNLLLCLFVRYSRHGDIVIMYSVPYLTSITIATVSGFGL
jgi:hypothetical protein